MEKEIEELFNKPSSLLKIALDDLNACEKDPKYIIDMTEWHAPRNVEGNDVCAVCLSGAVLAKTLGCDPELHLAPRGHIMRDIITMEIRNKISALDYVRRGGVLEYLTEFDVAVKDLNKYSQRIHQMPTYSENRKSFKLKLRALQRRLEKGGL